jgi:hypothetical protein
VRNYKTKERAVVKYVKTRFPNAKWVCDKEVEGGCSKKRPDMCLDCGDFIIIVEIDEYQHKQETDGYSSTCEEARLNGLYGDFGCRKLVFIRFNPDGYMSDGVRVSSCWGHTPHTNQSCVSNPKEWNVRLTKLGDTIQEKMKATPTEEVDIKYLFFDT